MLRKILASSALALMLAVQPVQATTKQEVISLPSTLEANSDFSTLVTLLKQAELLDTLRGEGMFTVFAPTNEAFEKLSPAVVAVLLAPENKDLLKQVLLYHVLPEAVSVQKIAQDEWQNRQFFQKTTFTTASGKELQASLAFDVREGEAGAASTIDVMIHADRAQLTEYNILTNKGYIHAIDRVLLQPLADVEMSEEEEAAFDLEALIRELLGDIIAEDEADDAAVDLTEAEAAEIAKDIVDDKAAGAKTDNKEAEKAAKKAATDAADKAAVTPAVPATPATPASPEAKPAPAPATPAAAPATPAAAPAAPPAAAPAPVTASGFSAG